MPTTITFTANLLAETTYGYGDWERGKVNRAAGQSFQVGGKGINVSKMLSRLGADNVALCFPGGRAGAECIDWMETEGIKLMACGQGCLTRTGSVIRTEGNEETTFLGTDSVVSEFAVREAVAQLSSFSEDIVFAVCGSIQQWDRSQWNPLRDWISNRGANVKLVVDNYGPSLLWLVEQSPEMIKFNRDELELLFAEEERSLPTDDLLDRAVERFDCSRWIVTDGGKPIWIKDQGAAARSIAPPMVEAVSPTGCGDVFFATLIDCLYNKVEYDVDEAVELAAEYASRNAATSGIAEFSL